MAPCPKNAIRATRDSGPRPPATIQGAGSSWMACSQETAVSPRQFSIWLVSVLPRSRRIAKSGGLGLDLAIQAERASNGRLVFGQIQMRAY